MTVKERKLNQTYSECFTEDQAVENFIYLTNKKRHGGTTTEKNIRKQYHAGKLGSLLKRLDPIAFHAS